jgi:sortase A
MCQLPASSSQSFHHRLRQSTADSRRLGGNLEKIEWWQCNRYHAFALCLLLFGLQQLASAGYIHAKAQLAQVLIGRAWETSLAEGGAPTKPWPWADTWPVARLVAPRQSVNLYVLSGSSGNALAFGPGYETASAPLGTPGSSVIGGHRDTHFAFLKDLKIGDEFRVVLATGENSVYRVADADIVNINFTPLRDSSQGDNELLLITCYPFDALVPGGPLRYVVRARPL